MEEDIENSPTMEAENGQSFLEMELEALQSIYVNEVEVIHNEKSTSVSIDLHPATADNLEEQYVMMTLKFTLDSEYPHTIPEIHIRNSRGLSDEKLNSINQNLKSIAESKIGKEMLFEVIEAAKEHLTEDNHPCGQCAICLCSFSDDDVFTKTDCYHYFHSHCLARYSKTAASINIEDDNEEEALDKLLCPVCRLEIHFEGSEDDFPAPAHKDEEIVIGEDILEIQKKMADLYQKQVEQGGIIDVEAEKNKYLIEIADTPEEEDNSKDEASAGVLNEEDVKDSNPDSTNPSKSSASAEDKTKNDRKFNKQPRNKYPNKTNKRYDNSKPKYNKSDRERPQKDVSSPSKTVGNEEDNSEDDENSASKPSGGRSEANPYKRNERKNNYGPPRRHYDDDYGRGNYYRYPDSRGGNRGRRGYATNGYDNRRNFRDHGYRGRGGRSYPERQTSDEQDRHQNDSKSGDTAQASKDIEEGDVDVDSPKEASRDNSGSKSRQYPQKKYSDTRTQDHQNDSKSDDTAQASKEIEEGDVVADSPKESSRDNSGSKSRQYSQKKYSDGGYNKRESYPRNKPDARDGCPDRDSRTHRGREDEDEYEVREKDGSDRRYGDRYQSGSYQDRRRSNYTDIRYSHGDRDAQSHRRGGYNRDRDSHDTRDNSGRDGYDVRDNNRRGDYDARDNSGRDGYDARDRGGYGARGNPRRGGYDARDNSGRGSYGRTRNRGSSYRNQIRRENSEEEAQVEEGKPKEEDGTNNDAEDRSNRGYDNQKHQFSDRRPRGRGNPRRNNGNSYRQNSQQFSEKGDSYSNGLEDARDKDSFPERNADAEVPLSHDKNEGDELVEESRPKRYSQRNYQEDNPRRYDDRRNYNPQRGGFRDYDRNRPNSDFQSNKGPNYRNQRYNNDRPFRNKSDSYQYKNSSSRKYNSDQYPENSELPSAEPSSEKASEASSTKFPGSSNEKDLVINESSKSKSSESTTCKDAPSSPSVHPLATFSSKPPPGFSNPNKKVVYGLMAANPPPGFPRS